jgi:hypothetical protein
MAWEGARGRCSGEATPGGIKLRAGWGGRANRKSSQQIGRPRCTATLGPGLAAPIPIPRVLSRSVGKMSDKQPKARLSRWLGKVRVAWHEFQASRARDAVYDYLQAVFAIVMHFKVRRRTKRLLRHAFEFADLSFDKKADPFTVVIRCTCGGAADNKMISKWARALRYAAIRKLPEMLLKAFMKEAGGVNECAAGYADWRRRKWRHG